MAAGTLTLLKFKWYSDFFYTKHLKVTDFQTFWYFQVGNTFIWSFIMSVNPNITA